ncbi:MAG: hypothetical protein Q7L55_10595 [Actinomycetota bacterium]|nr:hypothetical protein [Actinomycetota bacterium]
MKGNIHIQEDPGANDHVSRIVAYRISDGRMANIARFKDVYFKPDGAQFITNDEESSGVIDAGEGGQLYLMTITDWNLIYG